MGHSSRGGVLGISSIACKASEKKLSLHVLTSILDVHSLLEQHLKRKIANGELIPSTYSVSIKSR